MSQFFILIFVRVKVSEEMENELSPSLFLIKLVFKLTNNLLLFSFPTLSPLWGLNPYSRNY